MKRKVIHLVYSLGYGGLEQVIVNLVNNSTLYDVTHTIITLTDDQALYEFIKPETRIYSLNKKPGKDISSHWRLFRLLHKLKADVIHTYNFGTIEYHATACLAGIKTRLHCEHGRGGDDPDGMNFWHNLLRRFSIIFIHKFIVVSPDLMEWGKEVLKIKTRKLKLIYNGVNLKEYYPSSESHHGYRICTVGRADPVKNQEMLIDAFFLLTQKYSEFQDHRLEIVGDGPIFNELESKVRKSNLQEQVHLLGYRNDVPAIMRQSDLFVLSSIYEAMPMTILEAMACQLPVIATNVGGVGYMVSEKEAWLVESNNVQLLADTIYTVYTEHQLSQSRAEKGRQLVKQKYSIDKMVKEYMNLYDCKLT